MLLCGEAVTKLHSSSSHMEVLSLVAEMYTVSVYEGGDYSECVLNESVRQHGKMHRYMPKIFSTVLLRRNESQITAHVQDQGCCSALVSAI